MRLARGQSQARRTHTGEEESQNRPGRSISARRTAISISVPISSRRRRRIIIRSAKPTRGSRRTPRVAESTAMARGARAHSLKLLLLLSTLLVVLIEISSADRVGEQRDGATPGARLLPRRHLEKDYAPRLSHQPPSVQVPPRKPHTIECPVESEPESEVKWFKDGRLVSSEPGRVEQLASELMFVSVQDDDTGDYACQARNYLGAVQSEPFRLAVQSTVLDERITLEASRPGHQGQPEFTCTLPGALVGPQNSRRLDWLAEEPGQAPAGFSWRLDGRRLDVLWVGPGEGSTPSSRRFRARRGPQPNSFVLSPPGGRAGEFSEKSALTCAYKPQTGSDDDAEELAHESRPAHLRLGPPTGDEQPKQVMKLDIPMGQPAVNATSGDSSFAPPADVQQERNPNRTQPGGEDGSPRSRVRTSLGETLADLYQIAKPTLMILGLVCLVCLTVLLQFWFLRRRARTSDHLRHRYMKHLHTNGNNNNNNTHHAYASSAGSSSANSATSSGASSALGEDPVLSSLLARTLSAPSASSLGVNASKKYKYYRGKVAAAITSNDPPMAGHDLLDAATYFAALGQHSGAECPSLQLFSSSQQGHQFPLPSLYNQGLAAREQARSLLQASEHMRSMGNLTTSGQLQRQEEPLAKQHEMLMSVATSRHQHRQHSHLLAELPASFASGNFKSSSPGPLESGAASLLHQQQQQHFAQHLLMGSGSQQQVRNGPQANRDEHYQLVSCSSVSPSSSSSTAGGGATSSGNSTGNQAGAQGHERETSTHFGRPPPPPRASLTSNHYSTISANEDDEDERAALCGADEELDSRYEQLDDEQRPGRNFQRQGKQVRASLASSRSSHSTSSTFTGGGGDDEAAKSAQRRPRRSTGAAAAQQDQLSPYAVSSICHQAGPPPPPPPMSSEAMRALNEQFDINQLMLGAEGPQAGNPQERRAREEGLQEEPPRLPFNLPPPPAAHDDAGPSARTSRPHRPPPR